MGSCANAILSFNFRFRIAASKRSNTSVPTLSTYNTYSYILLRMPSSFPVSAHNTSIEDGSNLHAHVSRVPLGWSDCQDCRKVLTFKTRKASVRSQRVGLESDLISFNSEPMWLHLQSFIPNRYHLISISLFGPQQDSHFIRAGTFLYSIQSFFVEQNVKNGFQNHSTLNYQ